MRGFGYAFFIGDEYMKLGFFGNTGRDDKQTTLLNSYETITNLIKNENADELVFIFSLDFGSVIWKLISHLRKNGYNFTTTIILPDR